MDVMSCLQTMKHVDKRGTYGCDVLFAHSKSRGYNFDTYERHKYNGR